MSEMCFLDKSQLVSNLFFGATIAKIDQLRKDIDAMVSEIESGKAQT